jgi:hypothetical protein
MKKQALKDATTETTSVGKEGSDLQVKKLTLKSGVRAGASGDCGCSCHTKAVAEG